jgi:hypothetical protein
MKTSPPISLVIIPPIPDDIIMSPSTTFVFSLPKTSGTELSLTPSQNPYGEKRNDKIIASFEAIIKDRKLLLCLYRYWFQNK